MLLALLALQAVGFLVVTQPAYFATDDFLHFLLAQERGFLHYLASPILGVYPAPGHRLATLLLHEVAPLNYAVARVALLGLLACTTIVLGQLTRTLAHSEEWWTVALLTPFALSVTLVSPVWWWSNGLPVMPGLLCTAVALSAWVRSYTVQQRTFWVAVTVVAIAAAGAFYMKFLLIPAYLLLVRLAVLPRLTGMPSGLRDLWAERWRWAAVAAPPAAFLAVFVLSGLAGRSVSAGSGDRPYVEYFTAAWFHALVPASFLNAPVEYAARFSATSWAIVVCSQLVLVAVVAATWKRSALAARGWALFVVVFAMNAGMIAPSRLPGFGVEVAYWLRYYPEVVFFLPLVLALGLRQGAERRSEVAWERTRLGRVAMAAVASMLAVSFLVWAPQLVRGSDGALAKPWFDNLRADLAVLEDDHGELRVLEAEPPDFVMPAWMAPDNRLSSVFALLDVDAAVSTEWAEPTYFVRDDGGLAAAEFRPLATLVSDATVREAEVDEQASGAGGACLRGADQLQYAPDGDVVAERLALRVQYAGQLDGPAVVEVETDDPERPLRRFDVGLGPETELVDLGVSRLQRLTVELPGGRGGELCIAEMHVGSLAAGDRRQAPRRAD